MVDIIIPLNERIKGTRFCKRSIPEKPGTICLRIRVIVIHAEHSFALNTYHRFACTGLQIILEDPDGGSTRIDHPQMLDGASHFAETATAALFRVDFYPDIHYCLLPLECNSWLLVDSGHSLLFIGNQRPGVSVQVSALAFVLLTPEH